MRAPGYTPRLYIGPQLPLFDWHTVCHGMPKFLVLWPIHNLKKGSRATSSADIPDSEIVEVADQHHHFSFQLIQRHNPLQPSRAPWPSLQLVLQVLLACLWRSPARPRRWSPRRPLRLRRGARFPGPGKVRTKRHWKMLEHDGEYLGKKGEIMIFIQFECVQSVLWFQTGSRTKIIRELTKQQCGNNKKGLQTTSNDHANMLQRLRLQQPIMRQNWPHDHSTQRLL